MHFFLSYNSEVDLLIQRDCTYLIMYEFNNCTNLIKFQSDFIRLFAQDCVIEFDVAKFDILLSGRFF